MTLKLFDLLLKHRGVRGGLIFAVVLLGGFFLLSREVIWVFQKTVFTKGVAFQAAWIMNLIGMNVSASGLSITGHGIGVDIKFGCNAVYEMLIFTAAMAAYPIKVKNKLAGITLGVIVIYALNLLRVIALFLSGVYFPEFFKILHEHVAQTIFILFLAVLWILWVTKFTDGTASH